MALLNKTVMNLTPVTDQTLEQIVEDCITHFGVNLYHTKAKEDKEGFECKDTIEYLQCLFGKGISLNTSCIQYEQFVDLADGDIDYEENIEKVAKAYRMAAGKKKEDIEDFISIVIDLIQEAKKDGIGIKIFKLGSVEYYCYTV